MATKKTEALAVAEDFRIVNRYEGMDPDLLAELNDQMDDLDDDDGILCRRIKVPAGGTLAFEVQGEEEDDVNYEKEVSGVIVFTHRVNAYWPFSYGTGDDENKAPICSSTDGKTGVRADTGEVISCETCPYNEYGSGTNKDGSASRGKACKNMRRVYLLMDGDPNIYLLIIPPTSIRDVNKQLKKIIASGVPYTGQIVSFTLAKERNRDGIEFSKVLVAKKQPLPAATASMAKELRGEVKKQYQAIAITYGDYAQEDAAPAGGVTPTAKPGEFTEVEPAAADDGALPFN